MYFPVSPFTIKRRENVEIIVFSTVFQNLIIEGLDPAFDWHPVSGSESALIFVPDLDPH
jgi:hypothetical protein